MLVEVGCLCTVDKVRAKSLAASGDSVDTFEIDWLHFKTLTNYHYMPPSSLKNIYFYHHKVNWNSSQSKRKVF
jgi:DNA polymerase epsilon subunit 1